MHDLEQALGQFVLYRAVLAELEPERELFLAFPKDILKDLFEEPLGALLMKNNLARLIGFDPQTEEITRWIG